MSPCAHIAPTPTACAGRSPVRWLASVCAAMLAWTPASGAHAQLKEGIDSWAAAATGLTTAKWAGGRVPYPTPEVRPEGLTPLRSWLSPVTLHVPPETPRARALAALRGLENAHALLVETGFGGPSTDAGFGGDGGVDVYLVENLPEGARAGVDATEPFTYLDAANSFGLADARVPLDRLPACVTSAYVQTLAMHRDPSEAESVRRAEGAYLAWLVTGEFGCDDAPYSIWHTPWRTFMGQTTDASGAGFLALLGHRQDQNHGAWVSEIWNVARQRTWEGDDLRASPDAWEALETLFSVHHEEFEEVVGELAVNRYLMGPALVAGASLPPLAGDFAFADLPVRTRPTEPALETLGSAYYVIHTEGEPPGSALRIWLRGEYGVHWGLSVVRLDAQGRDLGRISAPARDYPRSFLALSLTPETAQVLIAVTNLSSRLPDADAPDENVRAAHLVIDAGEQPGEAPL